MSQPTGGANEHARSLLERISTVVPDSQPPMVRLAAALLGGVGLAVLTLTRIAVNGPVVVPWLVSGVWFDAVTTAAVVGPSLGAVLLGVTTAEPWERIGLVLVGVFGLLSALTSAIAVPTVGIVAAGGWLLLVGPMKHGVFVANPRRVFRTLVAGVLLAGLTLSLFGAIGIEPAILRPLGTTLALIGMAATPLAVRSTVGPLAVGVLAGTGTLALAAAAPFVSGAVALTAGSVVGASALVLATAMGGLTATVAEGVLHRRIAPAAAGCLLLLAGVPSSIPRALGVILAVAFITTSTLGDST